MIFFTLYWVYEIWTRIDQDQRQGLGNTDEIRQLMSDHGCDFDQARLLRQQRMMAAHGIDPEGCPLDPKAVYFS